MYIKSILLHLGSLEHHETLLQTARELATQFGAHTDVLFTTRPLHMPVKHLFGRGGGGTYIADTIALNHERMEQVRAHAAKILDGLSWQWDHTDDNHAEALSTYTAFADLVLIPQSHPSNGEQWTQLEKPEEILMRSTTPTLVLPWTADHHVNFTNVLVAWQNNPAANRAVREALPLMLDYAKTVTVLSSETTTPEIDTPRRFCDFLSRHGLEVNFQPLPESHRAAARIHENAQKLDCSWIVLGAFAHSRLHDRFFGSTTANLLKITKIPLFLSH